MPAVCRTEPEVVPGDDFRLKTSDMKRFLETGIGGEALCQGDKLLVFVVA